VKDVTSTRQEDGIFTSATTAESLNARLRIIERSKDRTEVPIRFFNYFQKYMFPLKATKDSNWLVNSSLNSSHYYSRPHSSETFDDQLFFCAARSEPVSTSLQVLDSYTLHISLGKLAFIHHALFSTEEVLSMRLIQLCNSFWSEKREDLVGYYKTKVLFV